MMDEDSIKKQGRYAIEAIFFDVGNVLFEVQQDKLVADIKAHSVLDLKTIATVVNGSELIIRFRLGRIHADDFFCSLKKQTGFQGSEQQLKSIWCDLLKPVAANIDWVKRLADYFLLAIISNTNDCHCSFLESHYDVFSLFKWRIYSHLEGKMKPDPAIFAIALQRVGVKPENSLFIDDEWPNVVAAQALGFNIIHLEELLTLGTRLGHYFPGIATPEARPGCIEQP